ncbi:3-oxoacyl-[acyl-carrier-protein] synthase II [Streptomyces misionensis]|uniref:3-oxoacyl-[acyl-carrier-protein] synthase II n=1 Tax=Streptomyces misionensis TaxID=67331 RepID=A0A1H4XSI2_9ACTN|nr:3-oxoacyl-[acyl-carrier-protein] synthase II [Streptomyces misionensis]
MTDASDSAERRVRHEWSDVADTATPELYVTGIGWETPLGNSVDDVWKKLLEGKSGITDTPSAIPVRSPLTAMVPTVSVSAEPHLRQQELAVRAAQAALADAGIPPDGPDTELILGTSYAGNLDDPDVPSLYDWARRTADRIGFPGAPLCVTTACSAGSDAVLMGAELIRSGRREVCVCVGVDVVTAAKRLGHSLLGTMSTEALRAFDTRHNGMVLGEGAGVLVLESAAHARHRSARVHAVLRGAGSANDAAGMTAPDPSGRSVCLAVERALTGSGLSTDDIAVVSAHGTGTPVNDAVESTSLRALFGTGPHGPVVYGTKGALGHSLGACGTIEAITLIKALSDREVPAVQGLETPMEDFPLPLPVGRPSPVPPGPGLSLTLGFGGFNTALLFSVPGGDDD